MKTSRKQTKQIIKAVKAAMPSVVVLNGKQADEALALRDKLRSMGLL